MAKLAYFPWYPAEAAADGWWMSLTLQEQALHLRLLGFAWMNGGLVKDLQRVAMSVGLTRKEFDKHWPQISVKWVEHGEVLVCERLQKERLKITEKSNHAKKAVGIRDGTRKASNDTSDDRSLDHPRASDSDYDSLFLSFLEKKIEDVKMLTPETDESWLLLLHAADAIPLVRSEDKSDLRDLWRWAWCPYSFEQRKQAIQRLTGERYPDPRYAPTLDKYIRKDWKLTPRPMSNGATNGAKPLSFADQEAEKNKRAVARFLEKKNAENAKFA